MRSRIFIVAVLLLLLVICLLLFSASSSSSPGSAPPPPPSPCVSALVADQSRSLTISSRVSKIRLGVLLALRTPDRAWKLHKVQGVQPDGVTTQTNNTPSTAQNARPEPRV